LNSPQIIIYDCDGVLIDSRDSNEAFYNHILAHFGLPAMDPGQLEAVHVSTSEAAIDYLFAGSPFLTEAQAYQRTVDNRSFICMLRLEPHVRETLRQLRPRYFTAIATNRGRSLPLVLKYLGLEDLFDLTVSSYEVTHPKPHPECLWKILNHFRLEPPQAWYVGDSEVDRLVALEAGVPFVAYKNPGLSAPFHIQDHLELLELLGAKRPPPIP
jgi:HAD superfamily hydrolase (TIGR01509 family)